MIVWMWTVSLNVEINGVVSSLSAHVRQYLWKRVGHHPAVIFRNGSISHADAARPRIHPLPSDSQPAAPETGGILPTRLVLHQRHRHERCESNALHTNSRSTVPLNINLRHFMDYMNEWWRNSYITQNEFFIQQVLVDGPKSTILHIHSTLNSLESNGAFWLDSHICCDWCSEEVKILPCFDLFIFPTLLFNSLGSQKYKCVSFIKNHAFN